MADLPQTSGEAIGKRLRLLRQSSGLSQTTWARQIAGLTAQAWNNYERGRARISLDVALVLNRRVGVSLDWIFCGELAGLPLGLAVQMQQFVDAHGCEPGVWTQRVVVEPEPSMKTGE